MAPKRNDPCSCGSGIKYKKCCGAGAPAQAVAAPVASNAAAPAVIYMATEPTNAAPAAAAAQLASSQGRDCGECNACCQGWLAAKVFDHELRPGSPCPHSGPGGCGVYERRPQNPCRSFVCGWLQPDSPFPENFRPDQLKLIFVPIMWRDRRAWIMVPTGQDPDETLLAQMRQYTRETGEPHMIKKLDSFLCFGAPEFQQDMVEKQRRGETLW